MTNGEHAVLGEIYFNRALAFCTIALIVASGADVLSKVTAMVALVAAVVNLVRSFQELRRADA